MAQIPHYYERHTEATRSQEKFDYYFLGIIIGLLSLSIHTFDPTISYQSYYLIIGTWILLLISFSAGFFRLTQTLRFKKVDLGKDHNKELAKKYLKVYYNYIIKYYKYQVLSFFLAQFGYALFKITNIYKLSFQEEIWIISITIFIGGLLSLVYSGSISKIKDSN